MSADEESDGFKFATMLLATLGTIIYAAYSYFQSRAIDPNIYAIFVGLITALLTVSILLIIYLFVKGIIFITRMVSLFPYLSKY